MTLSLPDSVYGPPLVFPPYGYPDGLAFSRPTLNIIALSPHWVGSLTSMRTKDKVFGERHLVPLHQAMGTEQKWYFPIRYVSREDSWSSIDSLGRTKSRFVRFGSSSDTCAYSTVALNKVLSSFGASRLLI